MARPRKRSTPTPPAPEAAVAGNGAEQLLGPVALASPDPAATDWIPMWGPTPNTLPQDTVIAAATRIIANRLVNTDANAAWQVRGDGRMDWGAGGGAAYDTNLYRSSVNTLKTDGDITIGSALYLAGVSGAVFARSQNNLGNPVLISRLGTDSQDRFAAWVSGQFNWGPGNTGQDTNLYRSAAGVLKTDGQFRAGGWIYASDGSANTVLIGNVGPSSTSGAYFGSALDTNLYRLRAGQLKTDGQLIVNRIRFVGDYQGGGVGTSNGYISVVIDDATTLKIALYN